jgi:hypothetical protein
VFRRAHQGVHKDKEMVGPVMFLLMGHQEVHESLFKMHNALLWKGYILFATFIKYKSLPQTSQQATKIRGDR